jgi:NAD(P)-dependent dehydrogenase (short-subunit alcohol dehydrogenase family)
LHSARRRKFAVKGFTETLITDLQINAPHIKCSVVMPGQIGTSIRANTRLPQPAPFAKTSKRNFKPAM